MKLNPHKSLGLAISEQGITAVQTGMSAGRRTVLHTASLAFTEELNLGQPEKLGRELRSVLRGSGMTASRCVVGLAATWIASREKALPATEDSSLRGVLSIAAEREFASGPQELSFDYFARPSGTGLFALLAAAPRRVVEQLAAMAKAAGLSMTAITSSSIALATATRGADAAADRLMLCLQPRGVELVAQAGGGVRMIRHLPLRLDQEDNDNKAGRLSGELRRIFALAPSDHRSGQTRELLVWDSVGLNRSVLETVGRELGFSLRRCEPASDLDLAAGPAALEGGQFAQATALACCADQPLAIDFLHSRLAPPRKARAPRWAVFGGVAGGALLAAGLYLLLDWRATRGQVAVLRGQLASLKDSTHEANTLVGQILFARTWYDHRPDALDCLRDVTKAFPQEGRIWATSLVIREEKPATPTGRDEKSYMQVILTGKSVNEAAVLEVLDRLSGSPKAANVKPLFIRQAGGTSRDVSFAISLALPGAP